MHGQVLCGDRNDRGYDVVAALQACWLSVFGLLMFGFEAQLLAERSISARCCFVGDSRGGFGGAGQVSIGFVLGSAAAGAQVVSGFVISGCGGFTV